MEKDLLLSIPLSEAMFETKIVAEQGIIKDVVLLTGNKTTKNKTLYTKKALSEGVSRYEGSKMFIDHAEGNRSVRDLGGHYRNVRLSENFLKADLHLLPNQSVRDIIFPLAEAKIEGVGFSIRDRGHGREENGIFLVEGFVKGASHSIDLVSDASANRNFFEQTKGNNVEDDMELKELKLEDLKKANPGLVESISTDARAGVMKELEGDIKSGKDGKTMLARGEKFIELSKAQFPTDIMESVKKLIEPENITIDQAKALIESHKILADKLKDLNKPDPKKNQDPKIKGHGNSNDRNIDEQSVPSADELAECFN